MQTQDTYTRKICKRCNRETILLTKEVNEAIKEGKYLACTYCGSKSLKDTDKYYGIEECFKNYDKSR